MASKVLSIEDQPNASRVGTPSIESSGNNRSATGQAQLRASASRDPQQPPIELDEKSFSADQRSPGQYRGPLPSQSNSGPPLGVAH